jgi:hypothetical protein
MTRPTISRGSYGPDVITVQTCLEVEPIDGDFGSITERAVMAFQRDGGLEDDGIVGPDTWAALESVYDLPSYPPPLPPPLDGPVQLAVMQIADDSTISRYDWKDRGVAPGAYIRGMAIAFAIVVQKWLLEDTSAREMAQASTHEPDLDALAWYADVFADNGMSNERDGLEALRHLFVLLMGLGMRESSGQYCVGRDMSADNVSSDTAEAGLFQMSWNMVSSSPEMQKLFDQFDGCPAGRCSLEVFKQGVSCSQSDWSCYGAGDGYDYQKMAKNCPQFAVETAAVGLRNRRQHWGPINRKEAEVMPEADEMFASVQELIAPTAV